MKRPGVLMTFDQVPYGTAWELQRALVEERLADRRPDTLVLLEHQPVYTIGRSGQESHWGGDEGNLRKAGYPVYRVERGGSVTYHGPGQIVGYPILRLGRFFAGPKAYMRALEEVLIRTLAEWGMTGRRIDKLTGVWVGDRERMKIAALGVRIVRGITMHGFALNVMLDVAPFHRIVPCGIAECRVTSMAEVLGRPLEVSLVRRRLAEVFADLFGLAWTEHESGCGDQGIPARPASAPACDRGVRARLDANGGNP
ncbi:MAG: lipoyl(octanoyl) transferase LipB [Nitrospiraceae bacterium]